MSANKTIKLHSSSVQLEDNIVVFTPQDETEITMDDAKEITNAIYELAEGKPFVILINSEHSFNHVSKEVMDYIVNEERLVKIRKAQGIVLTSLALRLITKIYISLQKSKEPIRIFSSYESAKEWLTEVSREINE